MLLVRSKELKNLNKKHPSSSVLAGFLLFCTSFSSSTVQAQENKQSVMSVDTSISVILSLLLVIAIIIALAYLMRRFNVAQAGNGQMRVVASMMAGAKEKVMVIEVGDEQHLLGITAHNINHLAKLEQPLSNANKSSASGISGANGNNLGSSFQQKLVSAMAQTITGGKEKNVDKNNQGEKNV